MRRVAIIGSTGSIGRQALEVVEALPEKLRVVGLAARGGDPDGFARQVLRWRPEVAALSEPGAAEVAERLTGRPVLAGPEGVVEVATYPGADIVLNALVGFAGLAPTLAAIGAGKTVALANKESLVAGGALVTSSARDRGVELIPVDSEPSAIFQLLAGRGGEELESITLTASGGPFHGWPAGELRKVTREQALAHPTWRMGPKITVDSATLMNKGLEVIEAAWFFDLPVDRISVLVHRQSLVHSLAVLRDGVILAHLGPPDMRYPIQYALTYPERLAAAWPRLDLAQEARLTFEEPDTGAFPCLNLAYHAGRIGKSLPAVLSAANEVLVEAFLVGRVGFGDLAGLLETVVEGHQPFAIASYEDAVTADHLGREAARTALQRPPGGRG